MLQTPDGRVTLEADDVAALVAEQFPHWAHLPVRPVDVQGWDNRTFRLGDDLAVRLPSAAPYAVQVEKEQLWLPRLAAQLDVPIPLPVALGRPARGYPWSWSVRRWLDGRTATRRRIRDLPAFAADLARFLGRLREVDTEGAPPAGEENFHRGGDLGVYDGETRAAIGVLDDRIDADAATRVWDAALETRWTGPPVWVHGDVAANNLLVGARGSLAAVIDFGSSAVGDPSTDLVIAWTFFDEPARNRFRAAVGLDQATWARARGWGIWKALITAASGQAVPPAERPPLEVVSAIVADDRSSREETGGSARR